MSRPRTSLDHVVLVTASVEDTLDFYERVLGAEVRDREAWRQGTAEYPVLHFQTFKINVHPVDTDASPRAAIPVAGALDVALRWHGDIASAENHLRSHGVDILLGPVAQVGAQGEGQSVYFRDLDGALLELICYPWESSPDPGERNDPAASGRRRS